MSHFSMNGSTCWICGHPAGGDDRTSRSEPIGPPERRIMEVYRSCRNCRHAKGTRDQIREQRNLDVAGMQAMLRGVAYKAQYWTQTKLEQIVKDHGMHDPAILNQLCWKEYDDAFAMTTKVREEENRKAYTKQYNETRKGERKEFYQEQGGKEAARALYALGGGREAAKARYANGGKEAAAKRYLERKAAIAAEADKLMGWDND